MNCRISGFVGEKRAQDILFHHIADIPFICILNFFTFSQRSLGISSFSLFLSVLHFSWHVFEFTDFFLLLCLISNKIFFLDSFLFYKFHLVLLYIFHFCFHYIYGLKSLQYIEYNSFFNNVILIPFSLPFQSGPTG